jgi:hypothetical protein
VITILELTALSFVVIMFRISICWMHKLADVTVPTILQSCVTVEHIYLDTSNSLNPRIIINTLTNCRKAC